MPVPEERHLRILFVGDKDAGKSSLIRARIFGISNLDEYEFISYEDEYRVREVVRYDENGKKRNEFYVLELCDGIGYWYNNDWRYPSESIVYASADLIVICFPINRRDALKDICNKVSDFINESFIS